MILRLSSRPVLRCGPVCQPVAPRLASLSSATSSPETQAPISYRSHGLAFAAAVAAGAGVITVAGSRKFSSSPMLCEEQKKSEKDDQNSSGGLFSFSLPSMSMSLPDMPEMPSLPKNMSNTLSTWSKSFQELYGSLDALQKELEGGDDSARARILKTKQDVRMHPELEWDATVRLGTDVGMAERAFLRERKEKMKKAFASLLELDEAEIDVRDLPVIAIAGSGGGYRAMVNTLGSVKAAQESGVWDVVSYVSAVSGSCWAMNTLYSIGEGDIDRTLEHVKKRITKPFLDPSTVELLIRPPTHEYILSGAILKQATKAGSLSLVDAYGTAVSSRLYVPDGPDPKLSYKNLKISHQRTHVDSGAHPLPIYCTIRHEIPRSAEVEKAEKESKDESKTDAERKGAKQKKEELVKEGRWMWFETTPHEVGCDELGAWIPTWSLGRLFENGKNVERTPELSLTIMSGIFASAFCATLYSYFKEIKPVLKALPFFGTINEFVTERQPQLDSIHPFPPAELPNFLKGLDGKLREGAPENITQVDTLGFMDAGANLNIPYVPLFRRDVDIALALDASADSQDIWFETAHAYAKERELRTWPRVDWTSLFKNLKEEDAGSQQKGIGSKQDEGKSEKAASKVDAAKLQEKEANSGSPHRKQEINPQTPPVGSAPHSRKLDNEGDATTQDKLPESQEGEPPLGKCNIWIGSTSDEKTPCRNDNPSVEDVVKRDGISLVYYPLTPGPELENVTEVWSTWRFEYTEEETEKMIRLAKANFRAGDQQLKTLIRGVYERKKKQRLEAESRA